MGRRYTEPTRQRGRGAGPQSSGGLDASRAVVDARVVLVSKLNKRLSFETTFGTYVVDELLGEGGAGRVFGGVGIDNSRIALKVLAADRSTTDKRRRFKNEIAFLLRNKHRNIVTVIDHGLSVDGPFYVMRRYDSNLRELMRSGVPTNAVLPFFSQNGWS